MPRQLQNSVKSGKQNLNKMRKSRERNHKMEPEILELKTTMDGVGNILETLTVDCIKQKKEFMNSKRDNLKLSNQMKKNEKVCVKSMKFFEHHYMDPHMHDGGH